MIDWDVIVIGAGSAGCAAAHELVQAGQRVLVLEAGGVDSSPIIKLPAAIWHMGSQFDWGYKAEPDLSRGGVVESWRRGKVLGGTSCINGMVYTRGASEDFERWSRLCCGKGAWSTSEVQPIFRDLENSDIHGEFRGHEGPLYVRTVRKPHRLTDAFIASANANGIPFNADYNGPVQHGIGYMQFTQRRGLRWNSADAFLKPHLKNSNLKLLLNATVEKLMIVNGHGDAVRFIRAGQVHIERARHILLSAGAINSPKILLLSGVGPADELRHHAITPVLELPGVGRNLREHPYAQLNYETVVPSYNLTGGIGQKFKIALKYLIQKEGPLAAVYEAGAFVKLSETSVCPDVQVFFAPICWTGEIGAHEDERELKLLTVPAIKICIIRSHSQSSGTVKLASADPEAPPIINYRAFENDADVDCLVQAVRKIRRVIQTPPISRLIRQELFPGAEIAASGELRHYLSSHCELACHPMGTCGMGVGPEAVVDPDLRVRGTDNVWIGDASIMPDSISANLNAPCMMIGAKLGRHLARR